METKLIKLLVFLFVFYSCRSSSQELQISKVEINDIFINEINIGISTKEEVVLSHLGKPINRNIILPQLDWDDGGVQLIYDSNTEFYYSKYDEDYYLENIKINSPKYSLIIKDKEIRVGSNIESVGEFFNDSYEYFKKNNPKPYKKKIQEFYVTINHNLEGNNYYTSNITFSFKNDVVVSIYIGLTEGN